MTPRYVVVDAFCVVDFLLRFLVFFPAGRQKKSETLKNFYSLVTVLKCVCVSDNLKMFKTACPFINTSLSVINFPFSLSSSRALHFSLSLSLSLASFFFNSTTWTRANRSVACWSPRPNPAAGRTGKTRAVESRGQSLLRRANPRWCLSPG
jgi:hypothetical protein